MSEADTCRTYVLPKLYDAGWTDDQIRERVTFTDGRIVVAGIKTARRRQKRADYIFRYRRDFAMAVVEAKAEYRHPRGGQTPVDADAPGKPLRYYQEIAINRVVRAFRGEW